MSQIYQAYQIHLSPTSTGSEYSPTILGNLTLQHNPKPMPGPHEALVRIRAVALNFRDLLVIADSHNYPVRTTAGLTPCTDGAGVIEEVGPTSKWSVGDEVIVAPNLSWYDGGVENFDINLALGGGTTQGLLQQYRVVGDEWLVAKPRVLSWEEAASLPTAGATAVNALFHNGGHVAIRGDLEGLKGKTVLTQGTGGVSCFAIQLAHNAGARVIATSSSAEKLNQAWEMGADQLINYRTTPEWADEVQRLTKGKGVDLVVDVGGAGTVEQSLKAARLGGTVVVIGILTETKMADLVPAILFGAKTVRGSLGISKQMLDELVELVEKHKIRPVIGKTFKWEEAPQAFEYMIQQGTVGKIVVTV